MAHAPALAIGAFGVLAAVGVGYLTSQNPQAQPAGFAVPIRELIIVSLAVTAVYAQTSAIRQRMALVLVAALAFASLWLLNGSSSRFPFSIGLLLSGPAYVVAYYVLLAHPSGRFRSRAEARFMALAAGATVLLWTLTTVTAYQPPLRTPLLACLPHCPRNTFFLGFTINGALPTLRILMLVVWIGVTLGAVVLIERRWRSASRPLRSSLFFVRLAAWGAAALLLGFTAARSAGASGTAQSFGTGYVAIWAVTPLAILAGLAAERLYMGRALARFVSQLALGKAADPGALMAAVLDDASLSIAYAGAATGMHVDSSGTAVPPPGNGSGDGVTWIQRNGRPVGAVTYDSDLGDQQGFIQAAADAAFMSMEQAQLLADLRASTAELKASRLRLIETAQAERERIERDLHDSVQQDLLGLRLKLEVAQEVAADDPERSRRMIAAVGRALDDVLDSLRALARGIYPPLLRDHGVVEAVRSASRRSPIAVSIHASGVARYSEDVEVAAYFCCLEGLQNIAKHAGPSAACSIRFWQDNGSLQFEVADTGRGFDRDSVESGKGLANMGDRLEALSGTLTVTSRLGEGTAVRGSVPAEPTDHWAS